MKRQEALSHFSWLPLRPAHPDFVHRRFFAKPVGTRILILDDKHGRVDNFELGGGGGLLHDIARPYPRNRSNNISVLFNNEVCRYTSFFGVTFCSGATGVHISVMNMARIDSNIWVAIFLGKDFPPS